MSFTLAALMWRERTYLRACHKYDIMKVRLKKRRSRKINFCSWLFLSFLVVANVLVAASRPQKSAKPVSFSDGDDVSILLTTLDDRPSFPLHSSRGQF